MPAPRLQRVETLEEVHELVRTAVVNKQPIRAVYKKHVRLLCPHRLGWNKEGKLQVLCYQYGGESGSGLQRPGSPDNWRCVALEHLHNLELLNDKWRTAENHSRSQTCIDRVEVDAEDS